MCPILHLSDPGSCNFASAQLFPTVDKSEALVYAEQHPSQAPNVVVLLYGPVPLPAMNPKLQVTNDLLDRHLKFGCTCPYTKFN